MNSMKNEAESSSCKMKNERNCKQKTVKKKENCIKEPSTCVNLKKKKKTLCLSTIPKGNKIKGVNETLIFSEIPYQIEPERTSLPERKLSDLDLILISEADSGTLNKELINSHSKESPNTSLVEHPFSSVILKSSSDASVISDECNVDFKQTENIKSSVISINESSFLPVNVLSEIEIDLENDFPTEKNDVIENIPEISFRSDTFPGSSQSKYSLKSHVSNQELRYNSTGSTSRISLSNNDLNEPLGSKESLICSDFGISPLIKTPDFNCDQNSDVYNIDLNVSALKDVNNLNLLVPKSDFTPVFNSSRFENKYLCSVAKSPDISPKFMDLDGNMMNKTNISLQFNSETDNEFNFHSYNNDDIQLGFFDVPKCQSSHEICNNCVYDPNDYLQDDLNPLLSIDDVFAVDMNVGENETCGCTSFSGNVAISENLVLPKTTKERKKQDTQSSEKQRCKKNKFTKEQKTEIESPVNVEETVFCNEDKTEEIYDGNASENAAMSENVRNTKKKKRCNIWITKKQKWKKTSKPIKVQKQENQSEISHGKVFCDTYVENEIENFDLTEKCLPYLENPSLVNIELLNDSELWKSPSGASQTTVTSNRISMFNEKKCAFQSPNSDDDLTLNTRNVGRKQKNAKLKRFNLESNESVLVKRICEIESNEVNVCDNVIDKLQDTKCNESFVNISMTVSKNENLANKSTSVINNRDSFQNSLLPKVINDLNKAATIKQVRNKEHIQKIFQKERDESKATKEKSVDITTQSNIVTESQAQLFHNAHSERVLVDEMFSLHTHSNEAAAMKTLMPLDESLHFESESVCETNVSSVSILQNLNDFETLPSSKSSSSSIIAVYPNSQLSNPCISSAKNSATGPDLCIYDFPIHNPYKNEEVPTLALTRSSFCEPEKVSSPFPTFPRNLRKYPQKRSCCAEDESGSDRENNVKRFCRDGDNYTKKQSPKSEDLHVIKKYNSSNQKHVSIIQNESKLNNNTSLLIDSDDGFYGLYSGFSNSPKKLCNLIELSAKEQNISEQLDNSIKSKITAGHFLHLTDILRKMKNHCVSGKVDEALSLADTYISFNYSPEASKCIIQELFSSFFVYILNNNSKNVVQIKVFDHLIKLMYEYNINDRKVTSEFIIKCCSHPDLNIYAIKMYHSCQNRHFPLNNKAINIFGKFLKEQNISLPTLLDFLEYIKNDCRRNISKDLMQVVLRKCKSSKISEVNRICLLLHIISCKEVDLLDIQEFLQLCFKRRMWTYVSRLFVSWCKRSEDFAFCIYNALGAQIETSSQYFKKLAASLCDNSRSFPSSVKGTFGQFGTALMLNAFSKHDLIHALEILYTLHEYNIDYFELQRTTSNKYLSQASDNSKNLDIMIFPYFVVFIAIDICLQLKRPKDAFIIFQDHNWIASDEIINEAVKSYVIKERYLCLLKLVPLLMNNDTLNEGWEALNVLLYAVEHDLTDDDVKQNTKGLTAIYNQYLVSLMNSGKMTSIKNLYQHSLGPRKKIFDLSFNVIRGLIAVFSENKMLKEVCALFMWGLIKNYYSIEKPYRKNFPWHMTIVTNWTVHEIKLAIEWFLYALFPLLTKKRKKITYEQWFSVKICFKVEDDSNENIEILKEGLRNFEHYVEKVNIALQSMEPSLELCENADKNDLSITPDSLYNFWKHRYASDSPTISSIIKNLLQPGKQKKNFFGKEGSSAEEKSCSLSSSHSTEFLNCSQSDLNQSRNLTTNSVTDSEIDDQENIHNHSISKDRQLTIEQKHDDSFNASLNFHDVRTTSEEISVMNIPTTENSNWKSNISRKLKLNRWQLTKLKKLNRSTKLMLSKSLTPVSKKAPIPKKLSMLKTLFSKTSVKNIPFNKKKLKPVAVSKVKYINKSHKFENFAVSFKLDSPFRSVSNCSSQVATENLNIVSQNINCNKSTKNNQGQWKPVVIRKDVCNPIRNSTSNAFQYEVPEMKGKKLLKESKDIVAPTQALSGNLSTLSYEQPATLTDCIQNSKKIFSKTLYSEDSSSLSANNNINLSSSAKLQMQSMSVIEKRFKNSADKGLPSSVKLKKIECNEYTTSSNACTEASLNKRTKEELLKTSKIRMRTPKNPDTSNGCTTSCDDNEVKKVIQFLKIKVALKYKNVNSLEQNLKAAFLTQTFIKNSPVFTKLDKKTMKLLLEFAETHV